MSRIFYWMNNADTPGGGEKHSYEHVDILNAAGFDAYGVHLTRDRFTWFDNATRIVTGPAFWQLFDARDDYLVLPENLGLTISGLPGKKVIFNKNFYGGLRVLDGGARAVASPYTDSQVVAIFAVSEHNLRHLQFVFPSARIVRVYSAVDPTLHQFRHLHEKKKRIVVVHKQLDALSVLMQMLRSRADAGLNRLKEYEVTMLGHLPLRDAAQALREALLVISLSTQEGLPRTILEAMSCGCLIAGYGTGPLKEILPAEYAREADDLIGLVRHIESIIDGFPGNAATWSPIADAARARVAAYTPARQRTVLVDAWRDILATTGARQVTTM